MMSWSKEVAVKSEDRVQGSGGGGGVDLHTICRYSLKDVLKDRKRRLKSFGSEQLEGPTAINRTGKEHKCTGLGEHQEPSFQHAEFRNEADEPIPGAAKGTHTC